MKTTKVAVTLPMSGYCLILVLFYWTKLGVSVPLPRYSDAPLSEQGSYGKLSPYWNRPGRNIYIEFGDTDPSSSLAQANARILVSSDKTNNYDLGSFNGNSRNKVSPYSSSFHRYHDPNFDSSLNNHGSSHPHGLGHKNNLPSSLDSDSGAVPSVIHGDGDENFDGVAKSATFSLKKPSYLAYSPLPSENSPHHDSQEVGEELAGKVVASHSSLSPSSTPTPTPKKISVGRTIHRKVSVPKKTQLDDDTILTENKESAEKVDNEPTPKNPVGRGMHRAPPISKTSSSGSTSGNAKFSAQILKENGIDASETNLQNVSYFPKQDENNKLHPSDKLAGRTIHRKQPKFSPLTPISEYKTPEYKEPSLETLKGVNFHLVQEKGSKAEEKVAGESQPITGSGRSIHRKMPSSLPEYKHPSFETLKNVHFHYFDGNVLKPYILGPDENPFGSSIKEDKVEEAPSSSTSMGRSFHRKIAPSSAQKSSEPSSTEYSSSYEDYDEDYESQSEETEPTTSGSSLDKEIDKKPVKMGKFSKSKSKKKPITQNQDFKEKKDTSKTSIHKNAKVFERADNEASSEEYYSEESSAEDKSNT